MVKKYQNELFRKFSEAKVLVIGDVMLDRYWWGNVDRISPEAPVPIVSLNQTTLVAGGAANVAANVAGLGAIPILVGVVGEDAESEILLSVLADKNISNDFIIPIHNRQTTVKTRIIAHNQQVVRIDQENTEPLKTEEVKIVLKKISKMWDKIEIVIISDYAKGFLTEELVVRLITIAKEQKKMILVDPKGSNYSKYKGATLLTPNQMEAAKACKLEMGDMNLINTAGRNLLKEVKAEAVLITQGGDGMTLFQQGKSSIKIKAAARKVFDVTGAGDTVIACLAVALASGLDFEQSAQIANLAAGAVVEHIGTTAITRQFLYSAFF